MVGQVKACNDCPFMTRSPLNGSPEWLKDVLQFHSADQYFHHTCHKTDPNADGFAGKTEKPVECKGHLAMMFNEMEKTPGKGGVYKSITEMAQTYVDHWTAELEKRKNEKRHN